MTVIAMISQKGGSGKTTLALGPWPWPTRRPAARPSWPTSIPKGQPVPGIAFALCSRRDRRRGPRAPGGPLLPRLLRPLLLPAALHHLRRPPAAQLRPGNADPAGGVEASGSGGRDWRSCWADASYAREEILAWCEGNGVDYVIGLARNSRLVEKIGWELADAQAEAKRRGRPARRFKEFLYATLTSWSRKRRVVAKAEHLPGKANPRFVVTSLPDTFSARTVYDTAPHASAGALAAAKLASHVDSLATHVDSVAVHVGALVSQVDGISKDVATMVEALVSDLDPTGHHR